MRQLADPDRNEGLRPGSSPRRYWSRRRPSKRALLAILAAVLIGGSALAWFGANLLIERAMGHPEEATARYLPASTQGYLTINLRPGIGQIRKARRLLSTFEGTSGFDKRRNELVEDLDDEAGINVMEDILPWVGKDITFAILDAPRATEPPWVVLIQTRDPDASRSFLDKLDVYLKDGNDVGPDQGRRSRNIVPRFDSDEPVGLGLTDTYVLIGSSAAVVEATVRDLESPRPGRLSEDATFIQYGRQLPGERFMFMFVRGEALFDWGDSKVPQLSGASSQFGPEVIGVSGSFIEDAVRLDLYFETVGGEPMLIEANPLTLADALPDDTLLMISSTGVEYLWQQLRAFLNGRGDYRNDRIDQAVDALKDETGVDLEQDVIGELIGQTAVALFSGDTGSDRTGAIDAVVLADVGDSRGLHSAVERLVRFVMEVWDLPSRRTAVGDHKAVTLDFSEQTLPARSYSPGYLLDEQLVVVGTTLDALTRVADTLDGKVQPLKLDPAFPRLMEMAPSASSLVVLGDIAGLTDIVVDALPPVAKSVYDEELRQLLEPLRIFFVAGAFLTEGTRFIIILTTNSPP